MGRCVYSLLSSGRSKLLYTDHRQVFIVTGASGGLGLELAKILYASDAKVYIAARNESKARQAMDRISKESPNSRGLLEFLHLDLDDLTTIHKSASDFLAREDKLHVLWNNAGVMCPPQGSLTKQGFEMQLGVNNIAPQLFTKLLTPLLIKTAKTSSPGTVRVVWVSSGSARRFAPKGGVEMDNLDYKRDCSAWVKYGASKAGNILQAAEFARRHGQDGVLSVVCFMEFRLVRALTCYPIQSCDPGLLKSDLHRHIPTWQHFLISFLQQEPIMGAYVELFSGLSTEITPEKNGAFGMIPLYPQYLIVFF